MSQYQIKKPLTWKRKILPIGSILDIEPRDDEEREHIARLMTSGVISDQITLPAGHSLENLAKTTVKPKVVNPVNPAVAVDPPTTEPSKAAEPDDNASKATSKAK